MFQDALAALLAPAVAPGREPDSAPQPPPAVGFAVERVAAPERPEGFRMELRLNGEPIPPAQDVQQLIDSIVQDFGDVPQAYLVAAGHGRYRAGAAAPDAGSGPPEGAFVYDEWDHVRQHYRRGWCAVRERDVHPVRDGFVEQTLAKHGGLLRQLYRAFEALRGEDRILKRQPFGEDVDIDAVVQSWADRRVGLEGTDRLFSRRSREERDIAVMFMVDMSGSTKGWINDMEREALVLLCESLERLGDRYAIYGFSGFTHKRCELLRIKRFDEAYGEEVRARISGVRPLDYTRMGAAIRHLTRLLNQVEARTRLLVTLSDGRPDDQDGYRGEYGVEDTRRALLEARNSGVHPFCVTIDTEALGYLPHMYGPASFTVVSQVERLPFRVSDIYRRITR
jgi:nitric oxide reductase NorD protein